MGLAITRRAAIAALVFVATAAHGQYSNDAPGNANPFAPIRLLFDEVDHIVAEHFYNPAAIPKFRNLLNARKATAQTYPDADEGIAQALRALAASHTGRYTPDQIEYYELLDIFQTAGYRKTPALHDGHIAYAGIGMAARNIDGRTFVTHLYDGGPAQKAGLRVGDEIVSVDGQPYQPILSFKDRSGGNVFVQVRRQAGAAPFAIEVPVVWLRPNPALSDAIRNSLRVIEKDGQRIGSLRLWTYGSNGMHSLMTELISSDALRNVDGLVLDLRSRWGGRGSEAADLFLSRTREMSIIGRDGKESVVVARWRKPLVAIVDGGTRSSMEIIAYSLQQAGVPLIGTPTAGAVLTARSFLLSDHSLVLLAINDVRLDGKRFEGAGVAPDIEVPFDLRYANGADPQFDRAVLELQRRLTN
jgi:C-terminal processing protease CtpA/Prc